MTTIRSLWEKPEISGNYISTSHYTLLTFIPKNLFEQLTRLANLYFVIIAGLQLIPGLSPTSWFTTVFPLAFVLGFNAIKVREALWIKQTPRSPNLEPSAIPSLVDRKPMTTTSATSQTGRSTTGKSSSSALAAVTGLPLGRM